MKKFVIPQTWIFSQVKAAAITKIAGVNTESLEWDVPQGMGDIKPSAGFRALFEDTIVVCSMFFERGRRLLM